MIELGMREASAASCRPFRRVRRVAMSLAQGDGSEMSLAQGDGSEMSLAEALGRACCDAAIPSSTFKVRKPLEDPAKNEAGDEVRRSRTREAIVGVRCCSRDLARGAQRFLAAADGARLAR